MDENPKQESVQEPVAQAQESSKEFNFRRLEKKYEAAEKEKEELKEQLGKHQQMLEKFQTAFSAPQEEGYEFLSEEDANRLGSKLEKSLEQKIEEKILKRLQKEETDNLPQRIREKYKDYDEVVTPEAVSDIEKEDPWFSGLAAANGENPKAKQLIWEGLYHKIKSRKQSATPAKSPLQERMEKNKKANLLSAIGQVSFGMPNAYEFDINNPEAVARAREALQRAKRAGGY